jgi:beta-alanine degradation protein BauB
MSFEGCALASHKVQTDNSDVKITRWDFSPGTVTGWHTHEFPYIIVMLTDARMRLHDGARVTEVNFKAGDAYQRPAGVTHDVMNGSGAPMAFLEIEIKRPLG